MRKFLIAGVTVAAAVGLGALTLPSRTTAQQPAAPAQPDSVVAPKLAVSDSGRLKGPKQPIFFRHDIHAGQNKMQCQYCHYSVADGSEPGIPSMQTCMGCHLVIRGTDSTHRAEIKKLTDAWRDQRPIEWVRIHTLAKHAHFPHMRHLKALGPNACGTCHGDVARMPQVFKVNNINNMGFCISCHVERKVNRDCTACHY
ncbi:MAG: cytochrome c3 family protein [Gemmatimonadales bacterium]